jgi:tetratricopeptide (TPR) repeat protein
LKTKSQREKPEANWNQVRGQIKRQMAAKQLDSGLFEEAARSAREAVALAPESPEAYVLLALANIQRNKIVSAQQAVDAARTRGVRSGDLAYTEGILLEQRNQLEAAHRMYAEAEDFDPTNVDYFTARVECLISLNRLEEAAQLVAHASDRFDDEVSTVVLSARLALLRGDDATALSFIAKVRSTAAKDPTIAESFGLAMLRLQRYEEAVSLLRPAVDRLPEARAGGAARRGLAEAYLQRGQHAQALDVLGDYSRGQPRDARAQVLTAKAALGCADYSMALEALERAARAGADRRTVVLLRATAHWLRGSSETAISELEAWLGASPTDAEACCLRGEIALAANCTAEAMAYFEQAREIDPDSTWAQAGIRSIAPRSP